MDKCECCGDPSNELVPVRDPRGTMRWVCGYCHEDHVYQPHAHDDED